MNYAIIETGGKQYRVQPGDSITVEKITADEGSTVELDRVLLVAQDSGVTVGQPTVDGAKVVAEVVTQARGDKLIIFKYKPKTRYQVKTGHRQSLTKLAIKDIVMGEKAAPRRSRRQADGA
ncbi:MAG: 50S ribosomal protein L21 [Dehalococcoidia bacterium]